MEKAISSRVLHHLYPARYEGAVRQCIPIYVRHDFMFRMRAVRQCMLCLTGIFTLLMLTGCVSKVQDTEKLRDLEFSVIDKTEVPAEFKDVIEANKSMPFRLTYADQGTLYIAEGYGAQPKTGYSVAVAELYETKEAICIHTNLLGPEKGEDTKEITTYPYVVAELEYIEKPVVFD